MVCFFVNVENISVQLDRFCLYIWSKPEHKANVERIVAHARNCTVSGKIYRNTSFLARHGSLLTISADTRVLFLISALPTDCYRSFSYFWCVERQVAWSTMASQPRLIAWTAVLDFSSCTKLSCSRNETWRNGLQVTVHILRQKTKFKSSQCVCNLAIWRLVAYLLIGLASLLNEVVIGVSVTITSLFF